VRRGEAAVQSLWWQVQRSFGGNGQHPGGGLVAAVDEERLAAILFAQGGLDCLGIAEPPAEESGQRVEQDTAGDARLPAARRLKSSRNRKRCRSRVPCSFSS
jgi:hypothetical protein